MHTNRDIIHNGATTETQINKWLWNGRWGGKASHRIWYLIWALKDEWEELSKEVGSQGQRAWKREIACNVCLLQSRRNVYGWFSQGPRRPSGYGCMRHVGALGPLLSPEQRKCPISSSTCWGDQSSLSRAICSFACVQITSLLKASPLKFPLHGGT